MAVLSSSVQRFILALIPLTSCIPPAVAWEGLTDPYQVKAAFLYNFAKFVEWPPEAFKDGNDRISICVLGKNPFGSLLADAVAGKTVGTRMFKVSNVHTAAEARACHILFVSEPQSKSDRALFAEAKGPYLLTVGESSDFLASGGVINLEVQDSVIRIEINRKAVSSAKFRMSSRLLSLAAQ
jgi:YfiR/HmsC-like